MVVLGSTPSNGEWTPDADLRPSFRFGEWARHGDSLAAAQPINDHRSALDAGRLRWSNQQIPSDEHPRAEAPLYASTSISFTAASCAASAARIPRSNRKSSAFPSTASRAASAISTSSASIRCACSITASPCCTANSPSIVAQIPLQRWKASVVEISTNAQWVDWDEFEAMVRLEVVNKLIVSCDGDGTPESYERLRPPSTWEKFVEFLDRAEAPARSLGASHAARHAHRDSNAGGCRALGGIPATAGLGARIPAVDGAPGGQGEHDRVAS